jgi:hypothetical protein
LGQVGRRLRLKPIVFDTLKQSLLIVRVDMLACVDWPRRLPDRPAELPNRISISNIPERELVAVWDFIAERHLGSGDFHHFTCLQRA